MIFSKVIILVGIAFLCIYVLIDRIAKCIETCTQVKAYGKFLESSKKSSDNSSLKNIVNKYAEKEIEHGDQ